MKSAGIVRKVDELGRVVLPIDLRRKFSIDIFDPVVIFVNQDMIVLQKHFPKCIFCGNTEGVQERLGRNICSDCMDNISSL